MPWIFNALQVNSAFNGKRKMLRKSLQHICTSSEIEKALEDSSLPPTVRHIYLYSAYFLFPQNLLIDFFIFDLFAVKTGGAKLRRFC